MQVKATEKGFFGGQLREPGDTFDIETEEQFSKVWMEKAGPKRGRPPKAAPADEPEKTEDEPAA